MPSPLLRPHPLWALPGFEWVTCDIFRKEPGDGASNGELGRAQALAVNTEDREVAEGVLYRFSYISHPRCAPALFVFFSLLVCIIRLGVGSHYPLDRLRRQHITPPKGCSATCTRTNAGYEGSSLHTWYETTLRSNGSLTASSAAGSRI